jgi:hypothetical protein
MFEWVESMHWDNWIQTSIDSSYNFLLKWKFLSKILMEHVRKKSFKDVFFS